MRVSKKSLILTFCLVAALGLSAPAFAGPRERDGGNPSRPIARIIQIVKHLLGVRGNDEPTVPMPGPSPAPIP